jgi:uncharacterized protein (TIGR03083 family)
MISGSADVSPVVKHSPKGTTAQETTMTDRTDRTITALRSGHDALAAQVRSFTTDDLARRSGSTEWDISQVLSHLGSGSEIFLAMLDGAVNDTGGPDQEFNKSVWARWDAMSRAERADGFLTANETLVRRFESLDPRTREDLRIALSFLPEPADLATFGGMRISEFAHHTWDVKVAFEPAATLAPEATELMIDNSQGRLGFFFRPEQLDGRKATVAVHLSSPQRSFGLDLGETLTVVDVPAAPDVVLTAPAEWWLRLVYGRHAPEHTPATVELTGDALTLDDLRNVFPGF